MFLNTKRLATHEVLWVPSFHTALQSVFTDHEVPPPIHNHKLTAGFHTLLLLLLLFYPVVWQGCFYGIFCKHCKKRRDTMSGHSNAAKAFTCRHLWYGSITVSYDVIFFKQDNYMISIYILSTKDTTGCEAINCSTTLHTKYSLSLWLTSWICLYNFVFLRKYCDNKHILVTLL